MAVEGTIPFKGFRIWYRIVGSEEETGKFPLLCLHGGPGAGYDYLESLDDIASTGRRVIFYDQLGCGNSDQPNDPSLWTVDLFVEEVSAIRHALGLKQTHILGQSWGGMLGMAYALTKPDGIRSLTVASSPADMRQWVTEANRLRKLLPPSTQETLLHHEVSGTTDSTAYQEATLEFYRRHVCRLDPWPDYVNRTFAKIEQNPQVYHTMNGPSEFHVTGKLKEWTIVDRLGEIEIPTLITSGRHDEATPLIAKTVHDGIPNSKWVIFEHSSHMAHAEERERYMQVLSTFLDEIEQI